MPSQFGGVAVDSSDSSGSKFGGIPVEDNSHALQDRAKASTGSAVGDALAGIGSGAIGTLLGAYHLVRMIPGVGDKLPAPNDFMQAVATAPDTLAGHLGRMAENVGEFAIPAETVAGATKGASLVVRAAAQGGTAAGVRAAQTGGDVGQSADAGALGVAGPIVGDLAGLAASKAAEIIKNNPGLSKALSKLIPDVVGIASPRAGNVLRVASRAAAAFKPEVETAAADPLLDGIAQGFKYKDYASAPPDAKIIIERLAKASKEAPIPRAPRAAAAPIENPTPEAAAPPPQPAEPAYRPPVTFVPGGPVRPPLASPEQANVIAIDQAMGKLRNSFTPPSDAVPPSASVAPAAPESSAPVAAEPKSEMEDLLERSLNNEKVTEQAKAELNDHLKMEAMKKTADIIDRNQTQRALKLGRFLQDYGIQPDHIERMTPEEWQQVGYVAEVPNPSETTIQKTKDLLNMGHDVSK